MIMLVPVTTEAAKMPKRATKWPECMYIDYLSAESSFANSENIPWVYLSISYLFIIFHHESYDLRLAATYASYTITQATTDFVRRALCVQHVHAYAYHSP